MVHTLKFLALVRVAIAVLEDPNILNLELEEGRPVPYENLIKRKIPAFLCPVSLQKDVTGLVRPISCQVAEWRDDHIHIFDEDVFRCINFCWTDNGRINRLETAKILVHCPDFTLKQRFALAVCYWLVKDMRTLWEAMSATESHIPQENSDETLWKEIISECNILLKNTILNRKQTFFLTQLIFYSEQNPFQYDLLENKQKDLFSEFVTPEEEKEVLITILQNKWSLYHTSVWFSKMDINSQILILEREPYGVLKMFLDWPLQNHFMEKVNRVWFLLKKEHFLGLLHIIICQKIMMGWTDFEYIGLLKEFWYCSPVQFKKYIKQMKMYEVLEMILTNTHTEPYPKKYLLHRENNSSNFYHCLLYTTMLRGTT
ncbi:uncharacterized protein TNCT_637611 [Trichonephila clavata]|uniref:Uncharacterized protein n=1 Tax=Trichonephila clavata TaxID=2740835 RepID=A0A8X6M1D2_TRICU|nr:uncharacterized protein TNCT_637611 [Trichonephila clavata]